MIKELGVLLFLGINAWMDIRKKEVSVLTVLVFALYGMLWSLQCGRSIFQAGIPLGTGLVVLIFAFLTEGSVGPGDAWILTALGTVLETEEFLPAVCMGVLFAGVWALILLMTRRAGRRTEIPFIPFLLAGYVGGLILC
ncbi:MAG: prepilin peptidase [Blautia sp.]|nr:prepilin peptidase [Blautia sp.]MDY3998021.1 prepilin peptidase [Blautia sp.]